MILLLAYLITAAASVTVHYVWDHLIKKSLVDELTVSDLQDPPVLGCCCRKNKKIIPWHLHVLWILYTLSSELAVPITILYWAILSGNIVSWPITIHEHLMNMIPGLIDLLITRIPIRLYHVLYFIVLAAVYTIFGGIYIAAGGTDSSNEPYIYSIIDYKNNLVQAIVISLVLMLVVPVLFHLCFWGIYLLRTLLLRIKIMHKIGQHSNGTSTDNHASTAELTEITS